MRTVKTVKTVKMEDTWIPVVSGDSKDELAQNVKLIASKKRKLFARNIIVVMLIATCCFGFVFFVYRCSIFGNTHNSRNSERGYYKYQDTTFYYQDGVWYEYDAALGITEERCTKIKTASPISAEADTIARITPKTTIILTVIRITGTVESWILMRKWTENKIIFPLFKRHDVCYNKYIAYTKQRYEGISGRSDVCLPELKNWITLF